MSENPPVGMMDAVRKLEAEFEDDGQVAELNGQMEYVYKWMNLSELYLKATRYLFEAQGLNFEAAIKDVETGEHESMSANSSVSTPSN